MSDDLRRSALILFGCVIGFYLPILYGSIELGSATYKVKGPRIHVHDGDFTVADELADRVSVFCMILVPNNDSVEFLATLWPKRCNKYQFFIANETRNIPKNYYSSNLGEWEMAQNALLAAAQNYSVGFDWYLLAKDKTYIILENLREMASSKNPEEAAYYGVKVKKDNNQQRFSLVLSAGVLLSKAALNPFVDGLSDCPNYEEKEALFALQDCLENTGSKFDLGLDSEEKYRFIPMDVIGQFNVDKFSESAVSFHTGSLKHMATIDYVLNHWYAFGRTI